jgi:hypothetical protein
MALPGAGAPTKSSTDRRRPIRGAVGALLLAACAGGDAPLTDNPAMRPPVDDRVRIADAASWPHRRTQDADLDADGVPETIVLTSDVSLAAGGAPLWEDGHLWAVFVEDGAQRTLLYGAFVPNGHAEAAVLTAASDGARHVVIHERTPQQLRTFVVAYESPGAARGVSSGDYQVERWLPSLAE